MNESTDSRKTKAKRYVLLIIYAHIVFKLTCYAMLFG